MTKLFEALDVNSETEISECVPRNRVKEIQKLVRQINKPVSTPSDVHLGLDKYAT
jgi:hypothetical protein